jgi:hypothetical protein
MSKTKKKSAKQASKAFYDIIKASVTVGLEKPKQKKTAKKKKD